MEPYLQILRSVFFTLLSTALVGFAIKVSFTFLTMSLTRLSVKTAVKWDDAVARALQSTSNVVIFLLALLFSARLLMIPDAFHLWSDRLLTLVFFYQVASWGGKIVDLTFKDLVAKKTKVDGAAAATIGLLGFGVKTIFFVFVFLMTLRNMGIDITALIAGLGLGGIAIGLALQNILGDLFGSLAIVLDKPFVVGDFVVVGDFSGNVEQIGLKTTRVRSLSGEQLVFSNADLLQSRVRNYQRMQKRRIVFAFGVTYDSSPEDLAWVCDCVKQIFSSIEEAVLDRCHFKSFGDSSLEFETVYWVQSAEFNVYMDVQQRFNLALMKAFKEKGIEFAFPTRTVHIASIPEKVI